MTKIKIKRGQSRSPITTAIVDAIADWRWGREDVPEAEIAATLSDGFSAYPRGFRFKGDTVAKVLTARNALRRSRSSGEFQSLDKEYAEDYAAYELRKPLPRSRRTPLTYEANPKARLLDTGRALKRARATDNEDREVLLRRLRLRGGTTRRYSKKDVIKAINVWADAPNDIAHAAAREILYEEGLLG